MKNGKLHKVKVLLKAINDDPRLIKKGLLSIRKNGFQGFKQKLRSFAVARDSGVTYKYKNRTLTDDIIRRMDGFKFNPKISIIMPVFNVDPKWLNLAIQSVQQQWYKNWELCIVDDCSTNAQTRNFLKNINDSKIHIKFLEKNLNISGASNEALKLVTGEYIALMDNDDELTPDALYEVVCVLNEKDVDFLYSDEDKLDMKDHHCDPHFKPDFSPDQILGQNYVSHLGVIKTSLVTEVGGFEYGLEGAQDYDLYLKVLERTDKVVHIPKVLYHWRMIPGSTAAEFSDKSYAQERGRKALENALSRRGIQGVVVNGLYPGTYKVEYALEGYPLISIIIPFKDKPELLRMCVKSILKSTYQNFEIIGISNNSEDTSTFDAMRELESLDSRVRFYEYNVPFNYSAINNHAVFTYARGEHIVLLNNDIEIITPSWLEEMLMYSQRKDVGCVGCKLYYPNDLIQHAGVIIGIGGVAGHSHKMYPRAAHGYFSRLGVVQNLSAVTAACLMVKRVIYEEVGGLDAEHLKVAFNDVDFCLRIREKSYLNVFTPFAEAYHYESISRGLEDSPEKKKRFQGEVLYMLNRHSQIIQSGDPYYNEHLSLEREDFSFQRL